MTRIDSRHRVALGAKGLLLLGLGVLLIFLGLEAMQRESWHLFVRLSASVFFVFFGLFPASFSRLAIFDALFGEAVVVEGAVALQSRRWGYSLRMPDGHFAEYVLFNEWEALVPGSVYSVTIGRRSKVIVARPITTGTSSPG